MTDTRTFQKLPRDFLTLSGGLFIGGSHGGIARIDFEHVARFGVLNKRKPNVWERLFARIGDLEDEQIVALR